jgi:hypothetical protein
VCRLTQLQKEQEEIQFMRITSASNNSRVDLSEFIFKSTPDYLFHPSLNIAHASGLTPSFPIAYNMSIANAIREAKHFEQLAIIGYA